jgi:hypothetical protein
VHSFPEPLFISSGPPKIFQMKSMQFNQMYRLPTPFKILVPDSQHSKNDHFWEKGSRNKVIVYTTHMYQKLLLTYKIKPHVEQLGITGEW